MPVLLQPPKFVVTQFPVLTAWSKDLLRMRESKMRSILLMTSASSLTNFLTKTAAKPIYLFLKSAENKSVSNYPPNSILFLPKCSSILLP